MSVRKFRSVADMDGPSPLPPMDPENIRLACALSHFATQLHPRRLRPGVRKFHSFDEAAAAREEWEQGPVADSAVLANPIK